MITSDALTKSGLERFIEVANYKHQFLLIETEDVDTRKANAEFVNIEPYNASPYTGIAIFTIDRLANGIPFGGVAPNKRFVNRKIMIRQLSADEILAKFGHGDKVYLGFKGSVPATTDQLYTQFNDRFGLSLTAADIVSVPIGTGATTVTVQFAPNSVSVTGALVADLTTPVYEDMLAQE